jgi:amidohydrolase
MVRCSRFGPEQPISAGSQIGFLHFLLITEDEVRLGARNAESPFSQEGNTAMKTSQNKILKAAGAVMSYTVGIRNYIHKHPELRWTEDRTLSYIKERFLNMTSSEQFAGAVSFKEAEGGLWIDFIFDPDFDQILFRADVDALPIQEETGLTFASWNPGVSHACGHDMHTAMLLGAMRAIASGAVQPVHNLRFVFQRAEENPGSAPRPESGGKVLVEEGVLEGISHVYGLHIRADKPAGVFMSRGGPMMANSDRLKVEIFCTGGHVKDPHIGSNTIDIGVRICQELEGFALRTLGPNEPVSLVPAIFQSGTASNIRPNRAELWFAVRNMLSEGARRAFHCELRDRIEYIVGGYKGAHSTVTYVYGHPALINEERSFRYVSSLLSEATYSVTEAERSFGGEDFAYYLQKVPGSFWYIGAENPDMPGGHHTATFNPREEEMEKGVAFWLLLATSTPSHFPF